MQLRFPVSDVRPAWIDGSAEAWPAHSNLPACTPLSPPPPPPPFFPPSLTPPTPPPPFVWSLVSSFSLLSHPCHLPFSPPLSQSGWQYLRLLHSKATGIPSAFAKCVILFILLHCTEAQTHTNTVTMFIYNHVTEHSRNIVSNCTN